MHPKTRKTGKIEYAGKKTKFTGLYPAAILLIVIFAVMASVIGTKSSWTDRMPLTSLSDGWYYLTGAERVAVSLPADIPADSDGPLVLYHDGIGTKYAGKTVTTRGAENGLKIFFHRYVLYNYIEDSAFPRNEQMKAKLDCDAVLPLDAGEDCRILAISVLPKNGYYHFAPVYVGSGQAVENAHYRDAAFMLVSVFLGLGLGIAAAVIGVYLGCRKMPDGRFFDIAAFFACCSLWYLLDSSLIQNHSARPDLICVLSFYLFMVLAIPMLRFLKKTGELGRYRILDVGIGLFYLNALVQGLLNLFEIFEFIDMLIATHLLLAVWALIVLALLVREYRRTRDRDLGILLVAFFILAASGVLALLLYWTRRIPYYGALFILGNLIFELLLLANVIMGMTDNLRYRTEMEVYKRLEREDWLTGFGNRQPFEEALNEIGHDPEASPDTLLVFADICYLRRVNEDFGRGCGDGLVLAAARCLENALGAYGTCYRIGGNEFGAILKVPQEKEAEIFDTLRQEIALVNRAGRVRLAVATGTSRLYGEDGIRKVMSFWKHEADERMYRNMEKGGEGNEL